MVKMHCVRSAALPAIVSLSIFVVSCTTPEELTLAPKQLIPGAVMMIDGKCRTLSEKDLEPITIQIEGKKSLQSSAGAADPAAQDEVIEFQWDRPWVWSRALEFWHWDYFTSDANKEKGPYHKLIKQKDGIIFVWEYGSRPCKRVVGPDKNHVVWRVEYYDDHTIEKLYERRFRGPIDDKCPNKPKDGQTREQLMDPRIFDKIDYLRIFHTRATFSGCK